MSSKQGRHARAPQKETSRSKGKAAAKAATGTADEVETAARTKAAAEARAETPIETEISSASPSAAKRRPSFDLDLVSRYRGPIYGACILWIVLFHAQVDGANYLFGDETFSWLNFVLYRGNVGVDIFLFLSGISLYFSWHKNPNPRDYYTKRLVRLFVPVLIIDGWYWFIRCIIMGDYGGASGFIRRIALIALWTDGTGTTWFIELLLPLYLIYPLLYELIYHDDSAPKTALRSILLIATTYLVILSIRSDASEFYEMTEIALTRIPVFLLGCALGRTVYRSKKLPAWCGALPFVGVIFFFGVLRYGGLEKPWLRFFYLVGAVSLAYAFAIVFLGLDKLTAHIGKGWKSLVLRGLGHLGDASLEIYLATTVLNYVYRATPWYVEGDLARYLIAMALSTAVALVVSKWVVKPISKRLIAAAKKKPPEDEKPPEGKRTSEENQLETATT